MRRVIFQDNCTLGNEGQWSLREKQTRWTVQLPLLIALNNYLSGHITGHAGRAQGIPRLKKLSGEIRYTKVPRVHRSENQKGESWREGISEMGRGPSSSVQQSTDQDMCVMKLWNARELPERIRRNNTQSSYRAGKRAISHQPDWRIS